MNCFKVKTWREFDLTILKVKQIHYKRIEVFIIKFNPKSIITSCCSNFRSIGSNDMRMISSSDFERGRHNTFQISQGHLQSSKNVVSVFLYILEVFHLNLIVRILFSIGRISLNLNSLIFDRLDLIFDQSNFIEFEFPFLQLECSCILTCSTLSIV